MNLDHVDTTVNLDHIVATVALNHIVTTVTSGHIVATMILDVSVAFDTIVVLFMSLVALLTSSVLLKQSGLARDLCQGGTQFI